MKILLLPAFLFIGAVRSGFATGVTNTDSIRIARLTKIAFDIYLSKPDSAIVLANIAVKDAVKFNVRYEEALGYLILSKAHWAKVNHHLSIEYGFKALGYFTAKSYTKEWITSLLSLARTFNDLHNFKTSREFIAKALTIAHQHSAELQIADCNREFSLLLINLHEYDSALHVADLGILTYKKVGDSTGLSILYGRKARVYFELKDYPKSIHYNTQAILLDSLVGNRRALGISYVIAAENLYYLGRRDSAEILFRKAIPILDEVGNVPSLIKAHEFLALLYNNDATHAVIELRAASQLKDTLYNLEKNGQIEEMRTLYELERKDKTIDLLEKENLFEKKLSKNQRIFGLFLILGIVLLGLVILLLWRLRRIQLKANRNLAAKNASIEYQREEIASQAENLQQLNNLKTKLFSVIGHDLRGPLTNLGALLELLTNNLMTPEEFIAISGKLKAHLSVSQRTLENLLHWSLSQMDGMRTDFQSMEVTGLIDEVCKLMDEIALQKKITLEVSSSEKLSVMADTNQIQLVFRNLIHNALKFSTPGSKVIIETSTEGNRCLVVIKDFGIGITKGEIDRLTASDDHFTKRGTQQEKGTGLGLLLCKEFIQNHDGKLRIESEPGRYTAVSFTLPLSF